MKLEKELQIYIDGPSELEMNELQDNRIKGYTFNPSLFKGLGVKNYLDYSKKILEISNNLPVSLEVIGDNPDDLYYQSTKLNSLADNVYIKIPITYTNGNSTIDVIKTLTDENIKLNITAIFTIDQIETILPVIKNSNAIISVFAGRLYDIGINAAPLMKTMSSYIHDNSNCNILWASTRMHYDYITAKNVDCDIITMTASMFKKMSLIGKDPKEYSLETVKMFYMDAKESGFEI